MRIGNFYYPEIIDIQEDDEKLEQDYTFIGAILGMCLLHGFFIDDYFPDLFYYFLLHEDISDELLLEKAREIDQDLVDNLEKLQKLKDVSDLESILCQPFTFSHYLFEEEEVIELCENGSNIYVNNNNVEEYIRLRLRY